MSYDTMGINEALRIYLKVYSFNQVNVMSDDWDWFALLCDCGL